MTRKALLLVAVIASMAFAVDEATAATQAEILDAQEMLIALGYDPGTAYGFTGSRTRNAIRAFQSDMGMSLTGVVDLNLLNALDLEVRAAGVSTGSGDDAVVYAQWLEDLTFQAENSGSADS